MDITDRDRQLGKEMAAGTILNHREVDAQVEDKLWDTLSILGLMIYELTEGELRDWLTLGSLDLTEYAQFERARDFVSWFVSAGTLDVSELYSFSLVDLGSPLVERGREDEAMCTRMDKIRTDGIFFREFMLPSVEY